MAITQERLIGGKEMSNARIMMIVAGVLEAILAIPVLGGTIVIGLVYIPLAVMLIIHIVGLVLSSRENLPIYASVVGIVTSLIAWIPFVGWIMHLITALLLLVSTISSKSRQSTS